MPGGTKTALLNSAERAARELGFDGFSYADLAEDVGIRKASVHHHFPTKAALAVALMSRYHAGIEAACAQVDAKAETGGARLSALVDRYREALSGGKSLCLCVSFSSSRDSLPEEATREISAFRTMMLDWIRSTFEAGRKDNSIRDIHDPQAEAAATLALLEGAQLAARAEENLEPFDAATRVLRERLA